MFPFDCLLSYQWLSGILVSFFLSYFMRTIFTNSILCFRSVVFTNPSLDAEGNAWSFILDACNFTPATKKNLSFAAFFSFPLPYPKKSHGSICGQCSSSRIYPARIIFLMGNLMGPPTARGDHPICSWGQETLPDQMSRDAADQGLMYIHCLFNIRASFSKDISIELTCGVTIWKISSLTPLR